MIKKLIKFLIGIVGFVVILAIIFVILINLTPRQLKLQDIELGGMSFESLGIADTKFIDIYKSFNGLSKVQESDVVKHPFIDEEEKAAAEKASEGSSIASDDNYAAIIENMVTYDKERLVTYNDSTIAYMINNAADNTESTEKAIQYLKDAHMSIKELAVTTDGAAKMRVVCYVDLTSFTSQIEENLPSAAKSFLKIPEKMYIVSEYTISGVDEDGKLILVSSSVCVNGNNEDPVTKAIVKVVAKLTGKEGGVDEINTEIGKSVSDVIGHLGKIGTATTISETDNTINPGSAVIGMGGIQNGKITVITHKA